jgi:hypothetical protein
MIAPLLPGGCRYLYVLWSLWFLCYGRFSTISTTPSFSLENHRKRQRTLSAGSFRAVSKTFDFGTLCAFLSNTDRILVKLFLLNLRDFSPPFGTFWGFHASSLLEA